MTTHLFATDTREQIPGPAIYLWLPAVGPLPPLPFDGPFRAIVVSELFPGPRRQAVICEWLFDAGCRYMMAWGSDASSWDDAMDWAALDRMGFVVDADGEHFVMTTWHDDETLSDVFEFANHATHPTLALKGLLVLHLSSHAAAEEILGQALHSSDSGSDFNPDARISSELPPR